MDPKTTGIELPGELVTALTEHPDAGEVFQRLSQSHKREYIKWINEAKQADTRTRRIEKTLEMLTEKNTDG